MATDILNDLKTKATNIRKNIITTGNIKGMAHYGGSLSCVDVLTVLYGHQMKYDLKNPQAQNRDRFILSKGHCALALYSTLCEFGFLTEDELKTFNQNEGDFPTHAVRNLEKGIEASSGSLGLGLSFAIGLALAAKRKKQNHKIYVLVGNGELNEGSLWESIMFAGHNTLDNLIIIVDSNCMQNDGSSENIICLGNCAEKIKAFGWNTVDVDGHNIDEIIKAFNSNKEAKPLAVVAHTVKGKGVSFMENTAEWHHSKMTTEQFEQAMSELEGASK